MNLSILRQSMKMLYVVVNENFRQELQNLCSEKGELQNKFECTDRIIHNLRVEVDDLSLVDDKNFK